jgi:serine/threonine-protein kinase
MTLRMLAPGTMLSGRYQIADVIGESDLSRVYSAQDVRGAAPVALKIFDSSVMSRVAALSEYQAQARQASGLGVEGIARAYDFGIDANTGLPFSTAERISWASLDRRVSSHGPLGASDLSRALSVIARALDAAHAARIVHRDLKPQNVFISPENPEWVRITDFGVNAVRRGAPEALGWGGPPGYTPPDAVDAAAPGSPGVDLFALGVIAFFALTRATPFRSLRSPVFDPNAHWSELNQSLSPISDRAREVGVALDPAFDPWFSRALAIAPQERFRSAGEMARELGAIADVVAARGGGGPRSMPGIAAAIAQPLVFQPEPSPASLGLPYAPTAPVTPPAVAAPAPASGAPLTAPSPTLVSTAEDPVAGLPRKSSSRLPLFIGAGVVLFSGLAFAGYKALGSSKAADETKAPAEASATASATAAPPAAVTATTSAEAAPSAAPAPSQPARALFSCQPQACEWIVCDGKNLTGFSQEIEFTAGAHECSASKFGFGSKSLTFTATPGEVTTVVFDLPPLPATAKQKAAAAAAPTPAAKPAATPTPAAKPASTPTPAAKPATATKPAATPTPAAKSPVTTSTKKKKCSTFLGCK